MNKFSHWNHIACNGRLFVIEKIRKGVEWRERDIRCLIENEDLTWCNRSVPMTTCDFWGAVHMNWTGLYEIHLWQFVVGQLTREMIYFWLEKTCRLWKGFKTKIASFSQFQTTNLLSVQNKKHIPILTILCYSLIHSVSN